MRQKERINNFIKLVDLKKLSQSWGVEVPESIFQTTIFEDYWLENYDQRFGQALINCELIPDVFRAWIDEDEDILLSQGVAPEDCLYWTSYYDANMQPLPERKTKLIKDLDTTHINNILTMFEGKLSDNYLKAFKNTLTKKENE